MTDTEPCLVNPEVMLAIDPPRLRALLATLRAPDVLLRDNPDPASLARALFLGALPPAVMAALDGVVALASPLGQRALLEAARDVGGVDVAAWARERAVDLAAGVVRLEARGDSSGARCIERARIRLGRLLPDRVGYELAPRRPPGSFDAAAIAPALASLPDAEGEPWVVEDREGTFHAAVRWRGLGDSAGSVFVDLVDIERATGRVSVVSARPDRVLAVARALAAPVLGDPRAFLERPALTLKPVLAAGPLGLARAALPARVKGVAVVACQLVTKDGARYEARSEDALDFTAALMAARGGYASRATLRFAIEGASMPVDAYVELPNTLGVRDARYRRLVREALGALGVLSPGATADDVTTLGYAPEPPWRWREAVGDEGVARMKSRGLLIKEDAARSVGVSSEETRAWGHTFRSFPVQHPLDRGRYYAFADDWSVPARSIGEEERAMLRLDARAVATALRDDLGLADGPAIELPQGVLDVGVVASSEASFRVVYVVAAISAEAERRRLAKALAKAALPAHAVVLVPRGRRLDHSLEVELDLPEQLGLASPRGKLAAALSAARAALPAAAARRSPKAEVRLTVTPERVEQRTVVIVNGVACELQDQLLALLVQLVARHLEAPGAWTERRELGIDKTPGASSRLRRALGEGLPRGFVLVESARGACRLATGVIIEGVDWEALRDHRYLRVRKLAALRARRS